MHSGGVDGPGGESGARAALAELERKGWLTPAVVRHGGLPPRLPVASTEDLLAELEADREDL